MNEIAGPQLQARRLNQLAPAMSVWRTLPTVFIQPTGSSIRIRLVNANRLTLASNMSMAPASLAFVNQASDDHAISILCHQVTPCDTLRSTFAKQGRYQVGRREMHIAEQFRGETPDLTSPDLTRWRDGKSSNEREEATNLR